MSQPQNRIDFAGINAIALAQFRSLVREWCPQGEQSGNEWVALNPVRGDKTLGSFKINTATGIWMDFADDASGSDPISLYAYLFTGDNQAAAARELGKQLGAHANDDRPPLRPVSPHDLPRKTKDVPETVAVPVDAPEPPDSFPRKHEDQWHQMPVVARWAYRDEGGNLIGYASRIQPSRPGQPDSKDVIVCRWIEHDRKGWGWGWKNFADKRPLFNLHALANNPEADVMVVEGEKTAEAAAKLFPSLVVVTWPGGTKAISRVDWSPLAGRRLVLSPDNDATGIGAMEGYYGRGNVWHPGVAQLAGAADVRVMTAPSDAPEGWDLADVDWTQEQAWQYMTTNLRQPMQPNAPEADDMPPPSMEAPLPPAAAPEDEVPALGDQNNPDNWPFRLLGHDGEYYCYLDNEGGKVRRLSPSQHSKANLMMLADLGWWEAMWPAKGGADWDMALNALLRRQHRAGIYNPDNIRGRGAWYDNGQTVIHLGDQLLVDGVPTKVQDHRTRNIYEAGVREDMTGGQAPMGRDGMHKLISFVRRLSWVRPVYADLLTGFIAGAVICGALPWRPHIWIVGPSGSGKSWVYDNVLRTLLGHWALSAQSSTTEAGLRQTLGRDSRPVIFDEAEAEKKEDQSRMQKVLELMRQASSEGGAPILKGSANGKAQSFHIRSCFAFSSINATASQAADVSRLSILHLRRNNDPDAGEQFDQIKREWAEMFTPEFCGAFRARAASRVAMIRDVQDTFARACAEKFGKRRDGDQYGTLLACVWAMQADDDDTIDLDGARAIVNGYQWDEGSGLQQEDEDEWRCLNRIMQASIRVDVPEPGTGRATTHSRTVGELVQVAANYEKDPDDSNLTAAVADQSLRRHGLGVTGGLLVVSDNHTWLAKTLENSPWAAGWAVMLARLPGADRRTSARFAGTKSRAVVIPAAQICAPDAAVGDEPPF